MCPYLSSLHGETENASTENAKYHKTAPRQFYQLFTIFVARQQYVFPVYFILMTRGTKDFHKHIAYAVIRRCLIIVMILFWWLMQLLLLSFGVSYT